MRMLFVSTTSDTARDFLLPFAEYERERGHEVEFACSFESFADAPCRVKELCDAGFTVHRIPFEREIQPLADLRAFWELAQLIKEERFDLVHTHTSKASFIGRLAAKVAKSPITIYTAHDFYFRAYETGLKRQLFIWLEKISAPWCDIMLFVSEAVRQEALRYHFKEQDKLVLVGNGIDTQKFASFRTDRTRTRAQYDIQPDELWVGNIGRLVDNKGIDTFLRAAAIVLQHRPGVRFTIIGDGSLREQLEGLAHSLGIGQQVQFIGFLPEAKEVMEYMSSLDVFVLPTRREGLGLVYLEAMSLRCPVVGSRISPVTEVVKDGETGLLATVDDPEAFAQAILVLLINPELRRQMGTAGSAHVEKNFDLQQVFNRIDTVYQKCAVTASPFTMSKKQQQLNQWKRTEESFLIESWTPSRWNQAERDYLKNSKYRKLNLALKQFLDVAISGVGIFALIPVYILIAIAVILSSPGPILFRQERLGKWGKTFKIYKFRTMVDGAVHQGSGLDTFEGDPRITSVGKILREYHLDELPQLLNVFKGEMSLVGPRPLLPDALPTYTNWQKQRLFVKPGITAWEAVQGGHDNDLEQRLELDVWYINNLSIALDLEILIRTIFVVLRREGVYEKKESSANSQI